MVDAAEVVFFEIVDKAITAFEGREWRACLSAIARGRAQYGTDIDSDVDLRVETAFARMGEMEAECLSATGRHEDAIIRAETNCTTYPSRVEGPYILGRVLHKAGRLLEAKEALGKAYVMNPKAAQVRVAMQALETDIRLLKTKAVRSHESATIGNTRTGSIDSRPSGGSTPRGPPVGVVPPLRLGSGKQQPSPPTSRSGGGTVSHHHHQTPREWLLNRADMQKAATVAELATELASGLLDELRKEEKSQVVLLTPIQKWRAPSAITAVWVVCCLLHMLLEGEGEELRILGVPLTFFTAVLASAVTSLGVVDMNNCGTISFLLYNGDNTQIKAAAFSSMSSRNRRTSSPCSRLASDVSVASERVNEGIVKTARVVSTTPRHFDSYHQTTSTPRSGHTTHHHLHQ